MIKMPTAWVSFSKVQQKASSSFKPFHDGKIYIDFDARTGHNHGTKFRIKSKDIPMLYAETIKVV